MTEEGLLKLENEYIEAWIDISDGMNVCEVRFQGNEVITTNDQRKSAGANYGMPILFPTPGRTRDHVLRFHGHEYEAHVHGLIRKLPFQLVRKNQYLLEGKLVWTSSEKQYDCYPYPFQLNIIIELRDKEIIYSYKLENIGDEELAYGFALHPFFSNPEGNVVITSDIEFVMENNEQLLPTGKLISLEENKAYSLRHWRKVADLRLDTVFYKAQDTLAKIDFGKFTLDMHATSEFQHLVIFTPQKPFFCIEPQTSSTDVFYLYARGYKKESGLRMVNPAEKVNGAVYFIFENKPCYLCK